MFRFTEEEFIEFHQKVALNVKRFRQEKNVTQEELAFELGFKNSSFVSNAENKKLTRYHYSIEHLYKIATILEVDIAEFLK